MRILEGGEKEMALEFIALAAEEALHSTCARRKCGAVLVLNEEPVGFGYNSPPANTEHRCLVDKSSYDPKITDKTCCVHAEQRAILDAVQRQDISGSILYFASVDDNGDRIPSGNPYCTHCSKMALDVGVAFWVLSREEGIVMYGAKEYNDLSYEFRG